jgi:hypothetical protein
VRALRAVEHERGAARGLLVPVRVHCRRRGGASLAARRRGGRARMRTLRVRDPRGLARLVHLLALPGGEEDGREQRGADKHEAARCAAALVSAGAARGARRAPVGHGEEHGHGGLR